MSLKEVIIMTSKDALYLSDACQDLSSTTEDYSDTYVGLDRESACNWAIKGFTVQGWLNLQQDLILIDSYVQQLRIQREYYESQLMKQYEAINK
jgi:hypothetical protein